MGEELKLVKIDFRQPMVLICFFTIQILQEMNLEIMD